jgi:transcriptional regulator with XRE-family HTH domain
MTFGEKLRDLREKAQLTREALAEASGIPFGTIHGYEIGRRAPAFAAVIKLAKALGVDCTAFAGCDDVQDEAAEKPEAREKSAKKRKK